MADTVFGKAATLMEGFDALCWYLVRIVATFFSLKADSSTKVLSESFFQHAVLVMHFCHSAF